MQQIVDALKKANLIAPELEITADQQKEIDAAVESLLTAKVVTAKNDGLTSGKGQVASEVTNAMVMLLKEYNVDEATIEKIKTKPQVKDNVATFAQVVKNLASGQAAKTADDIRKELEGEYQAKYSQTEGELKSIKQKLHEAELQQLAESKLKAVPNFDPANPAAGLVIRDLVGFLSNKTLEASGSSTFIKDGDKLFSENGNAVTLEKYVGDIASKYGLLKKSDPVRKDTVSFTDKDGKPLSGVNLRKTLVNVKT